jgi:F0F1-type ATP synthase assembly protein I
MHQARGWRRKQEVWSAFPFRRLIAAHLAVVGAAAAFGGLHSLQAGRSALAGAAICSIANIYAAWRVFVTRRRPASEYGELANLYRAEFGKVVMIGALSAAFFLVSNANILAFVGGCVGAILAGTLVAATFNPGTTSTRNTKLQENHGE